MAGTPLTSGKNSYQGIIDWITSTAANGGAGISKNADTAGVATKLGTTTVGATNKPIYLNAGTPTAFSTTIGSNTKPIYMNAGVLTAFTGSVGGAAQPICVSGGALTACSSTVGSATKPVYMSSGTITVSNGSVANNGTPMYMTSGQLTASTKVGHTTSETALPVYIPIYTSQPSGVSDGAIWIENS